MTDCVDLHQLAELLGVTLAKHDGGLPGWYSHSRRVISTRRGQSIQQYKSVLAHELAHAYFGDKIEENGHFNQRQEKRADRWAAELLITEQDFITALQWHKNDFAAIADELEVTHHILETWLNNQERQAA